MAHLADPTSQITWSRKNIVKTRQEAFDKYLVKCDVPKYPLYLEEASKLIRDAGGKLVLAHPNDPHGTSLVALTKVFSRANANRRGKNDSLHRRR